MTSEQFVQYMIDGITTGSIYALIALGFSIICTVTNIINFAQGHLTMLGGMISYMVIRSMDVPTFPTVIIAVLTASAIGIVLYMMLKRPAKFAVSLVLLAITLGAIPLTVILFKEIASAEMPVVAAAVIPILLVAIVGAVVYLNAIRRARKPTTVSLIIMTIGVAIFLEGMAGAVWGVDAVRPPGWTGKSSIEFLGGYIHPQALWMVGATLVITILVYLFFSYTMIGKSLKACAISPVAAGMVGIDARKMALIAFVLAGIIGGIGGAVMAPKTLMSYHDGFWLGIHGFFAAALVGFTRPIGAVVTGFGLGIYVSLMVGLDWGPFQGEYKMSVSMITFLLILVIWSSRLRDEERPS
ncbi:MAG: branched-chain amino acid ABC transporter permease [Chloroflexi bacterium]|nr:branched-chain amino acid ABC transporter permease [Chloroflexota bacterium]